MNYPYYSALDLAMDERFQRWVLSGDQEAIHEWNAWLKVHPQRPAVVEEARQLLLLQRYDTDTWPVERKQAVLERIRLSVASAPQKQKPTPVIPVLPFFRRKWLLVAACLSLVLMSTLVWQLLGNSYLHYRTHYGETREVQLPDGSTVLLNANSSLKFLENWQQAGEREVWLEGEAFFQVNPLGAEEPENPLKFIVHVSSLDVEVVGTAFNVNHRSGKVDVFLDHGIVDIRMDDQPRLRMAPGDMVNYSAQTQKLSKKTANSEAVTAWKQHQIILDHQPLSDLAEILRNYYGVTVDFDHPKLAHKKVVAVLPTDDLDVVLTTLETMGHVRAERKNTYVLFK